MILLGVGRGRKAGYSERKAENSNNQPQCRPLLGPKNISIKPRETCETNIIHMATTGTLLKQNKALYVIVQGSGNKKWNGAGGSGMILDKSLERCNRTALLQKICCYGEVPLKPYPLP